MSAACRKLNNMDQSQSGNVFNQEVVCPEAVDRTRGIISTLPIDNGWRFIEPLCLYQGFWCYPSLAERIMLGQEYFKVEPNDIFLCSPPKSGTTWMKALTFAIVTRTCFDGSTSPLLFKNPHECVPAFHRVFGKKPDIREPGLPLITTHCPYASLPKSVLHSDCKIVYICRDPKDAFVSLFHFRAKLRPEEIEPISLEQAFDLYCEGKSDFGPFWDHILGYWRASLEMPGKVLFLKYEDMMKDTAFYVKKLAEFMGYPFSLEEEKEGVVQNIVELCSFEFMSNLEVNKNGMIYEIRNHEVRNKDFFRKGKIGDWRNHLTPKMAERLDKIIEQKLSASGFGRDWLNGKTVLEEQQV